MTLVLRRRLLRLVRTLMLLPALAGVGVWAQDMGVAAQSANPMQAVAIGTVTLTIGVSELQHEGHPQPINKGSTIGVGDTITTSESGHVHIQFVDGARVSVRPGSILRVEEYQFDAAHPANSTVKFFLEKGVARAISGEAAHAAKDHFRLNTPLVAIGVKGTDFTTQSSAGSAVVVVNQGAIVLAPLDAACQAAGLGPCAGAHALTLSASMNGTALVYHSNATDPSFQPLNTLKGTDKITPIIQQERDAASGTTTVVADSTAPTSVAALLPVQNSLIWGRWASTAAPGDTLTVPFLTAMQGNQITVGDGYYFLFRNETGPNLMSTASGTANFALQTSSAYYRDNGNILSAATVQGGTLGINFTNDTFNTNLNVSSAATGAVSISATGTINPSTGIFVSSNADPHVAGAVSLNTLQAGYFFNKPLSVGGSLSGATLWSR